MIPWRFFGYAVHDGVASLFDLSVISGIAKDQMTCQTYDSKAEHLLDGVVEYRLMRELSRGYCTVQVVSNGGKTEMVCRDLRIRNFGGHFGQLDLSFDEDGKLKRKVFHV